VGIVVLNESITLSLVIGALFIFVALYLTTIGAPTIVESIHAGPRQAGPRQAEVQLFEGTVDSG
jgi:hypothetical protein